MTGDTCFHAMICDFLHDHSHSLHRSNTQLLNMKFVLHSISMDAKDRVNHCTSCQKSNVHLHMVSGVDTFHQRYVHIQVDVVCLLPTSQGHRCLFSIIGLLTHRPEAIPMENATSTSCTSAILSECIARFGIPDYITSDRGTTFTSPL
ncbi:uncharacterized protein [Palaemon carinicauda]|uniref:uncharacterized protein n=1 Tax=Palaemon carinicauda TaxID=392227 RepID=UPI0035B57E7D